MHLYQKRINLVFDLLFDLIFCICFYKEPPKLLESYANLRKIFGNQGDRPVAGQLQF